MSRASIALRFDLRPLWRAKWTVLVYSVIAVAGVQLAFYTSIARIPVSTALLIEYLAPVALVALRVGAHAGGRRSSSCSPARSSRSPGSCSSSAPPAAPSTRSASIIAGVAMLGVAVYYVLGERADVGVPPVALAAVGCLLGAVVLGLAGLTVGLVPFEAEFVDVAFFGGTAPWWVPVLMVGAISTAFAYVAGIQSIRMLGTRLVVLPRPLRGGLRGDRRRGSLLGEAIGPVQLLGGLLILGGIVLRAPRASRARRRRRSRSTSTSCR